MNKQITFFSLALAGLLATSGVWAQGAPQDIRMALVECSAQSGGDNTKIEACMSARGFRKQAEVKPNSNTTPARPPVNQPAQK